jgi:hypothetical protein
MSESAYFSQAEKNINSRLANKKYDEAYNICLSYIRNYPNEKGFLKLKEKIEEAVRLENEKVIEAKFDEVKILWKENKYAEILNKLRPLLQIAPHNEKLKKQILKAQKIYQKETDKMREEFNKKQIKKFNELMEKDENQFIEDLFLLEKNNPGNKDVQTLTSFFRNKLIEKKISEKEDLIYSDKFDSINNFISQLKKIDEKNTKIEELEKLIKTRQHKSQISDKSEFIFKSTDYLDTLMKLKKYDKAIQVATEILDINKTNKKVEKILKKAKDKFFKQTKKETIKSICENIDTLKADFEKEKDKFVKL